MGGGRDSVGVVSLAVLAVVWRCWWCWWCWLLRCEASCFGARHQWAMSRHCKLWTAARMSPVCMFPLCVRAARTTSVRADGPLRQREQPHWRLRRDSSVPHPTHPPHACPARARARDSPAFPPTHTPIASASESAHPHLHPHPHPHSHSHVHPHPRPHPGRCHSTH